MDLRELEQFLAVVETGSFRRAAEKVYRTQSAVSQSIKKLEEEIGSPLFDRGHHDVVLTEAGELLAEKARQMLRLRTDTLQAISELRNLHSGSLSIAAPESAALYLLPDPLQAFVRRFPGIKLSIFRRARTEIPRLVMDREVDIGFVLTEPNFHEMQSTPIYRDEMTVIASPEHPLVSRRDVKVRDLGKERFVLHHGCLPTLRDLEELFDRNGTHFHTAAELWGFESVKNFVRKGLGLAIIPKVTALEELSDGTLAHIRVAGFDMTRMTYLIHREPSHMTDAARELLAIVRRHDWTVPASETARSITASSLIDR